MNTGRSMIPLDKGDVTKLQVWTSPRGKVRLRVHDSDGLLIQAMLNPAELQALTDALLAARLSAK